jgi:hypothetical protein
MSSKGKSASLKTLKEISDIQSQMQYLIGIVNKVVDLHRQFSEDIAKIKSAQREQNTRLKAIEKKLASSGSLPVKDQGPEEWREIMRSACQAARGMDSVPIPWDKIKNREKFEAWFQCDVGRYIVDGKVGPENRLVDTFPGIIKNLRPSMPQTIFSFD